MTSEINVSFRTFLLFSVRLFQRVGPLTHSQRCFLASIVEWLTKLWLKTLNVTNNDRVEIRVNPSVWTQSGPPCCPGVLTGTDRIYYTSIQPIYQRTSHFRQPLAVSTTSLITPTIAASKRVTLWDTLTAGQTDVWLSGLGPKRSSHPQETEAETERWKITMFISVSCTLSVPDILSRRTDSTELLHWRAAYLVHYKSKSLWQASTVRKSSAWRSLYYW